jgi:hypothetical protein
MTGSIQQLNRQHSSTTTTTTMEKSYRPKFRRCSSADDHGLTESMSDINQQKDISVFKRQSITSDADSGTEEIEQQMEHVVVASYYDNDDQSSVKSFSPNYDEGFSECDREEESSVQTITEDFKLPIIIQEDRKLHSCLVIMTQHKFVISQYKRY